MSTRRQSSRRAISLEWKISPVATLTQDFSALWDADDFGDALYTFSVGLSTSIVKQIELKVELLDALKTKPPIGLGEEERRRVPDVGGLQILNAEC